MTAADLLPIVATFSIGFLSVWVTRRGKHDENSLERINILLSGQGDHIKRLQADLTQYEERLTMAERRLNTAQARVSQLWDLSSEAINYLWQWSRWHNRDDEGKGDPPAPDLQDMRDRLDGDL